MDLLVDIGNNYTKLALVHDTNGFEKVTFTKEQVEDLAQWIGKKDIHRAIVSTVRPLSPELEDAFSQFDYTLKLSHTSLLPIQLDYHTPETLGRDRIAGVVAARQMYPDVSNLVIDAGTCITYDFIDKNGMYLGGSISPGLNMRYEALNKLTGALPLVKHHDPEMLVGKSTEDSIRTGVFNGMMNEVNGTIRQYKLEKSPVNLVICGGNASDIIPHLDEPAFHHEDLILIGLHKILTYNALQEN